MINKRLLGRLLSSTSSGALPAFRFDFTSGVLDSRLSFSRTSLAMNFDSTGKLTYCPNNLLTYSTDFSNAAWTKVGHSSLTLQGDGSYLFVETNTLSAHGLDAAGATINSAYCILSFEVKYSGKQWLAINPYGTPSPGNDGVWFDIQNGVMGSNEANATGSIAALGDGWYRISWRAYCATGGLTAALRTASANGNSSNYTGDGVSGFYVRKAWLEAVTYETSPRPYNATAGSAYYGPRFAYDPVTLAPEGLWQEETRTNYCLWNRDLSNGAWTKTNVTAARTQTGIDGVSNSASVITATAANGTVLQAISDVTSRARAQSAYVKRVTGTGTIQMTMDNGTTWTNVTVTSTTQWTRVWIPTQTLANPTVGFRIVTNGDAIAVDFVANENGTTATTPIYTEAASIARANEVLEMTGANFTSWYNFTEGTFICEWEAPDISMSSRYVWAVSDGTGSNRAYFLNTVGSPRATGVVANATGSTAITTTTVADTVYKTAVLYSAAGYAIAQNGVAPVSVVSPWPSSVNKLNIGGSYIATAHLNAKIKSFTYFRQRLSDSRIQALTQ